MATLSTLSTLLPKLIDTSNQFAASDPILEQVRKKRLEREEQDRANAQTAGQLGYWKSQVDATAAESQQAANLQQILASAPELDYSPEGFGESLRNMIGYLANSRNAQAIEIADKMMKNLKAVQESGGVPGSGGGYARAQEADIAATQAEAQADLSTAALNRNLARQTSIEGASIIDKDSARQWLEDNELDYGFFDAVGFDDTPEVGDARLAQQALSLQQIAKTRGTVLDNETAYREAYKMITEPGYTPNFASKPPVTPKPPPETGEVRRKDPATGRVAVFDAKTKKFIRWDE